MKIDDEDRPATAKIYSDYRPPFLDAIPGIPSKELLIRQEDVRALHGSDSMEHAQAYLSSELF